MIFAVEFEPELPTTGASDFPRNVNWDAAYKAAADQPDHDLRYIICGTRVCYYPANLATLLNDLLSELEALDIGETHKVSMSGYTLLVAEMTGDTVTFRDPALGGDLVGQVGISEVRAALQAASATVWAYLDLPKTEVARS